jgi:2-oxoglutarate ferredoxin oxidoreductase subunit delta
MPKTRARVTILIDEENCKGCGLCVDVCPRQAMGLAEHINSRGFHPVALLDAEKCTACAQCALMCPEACMKILKYE